MDENLMIDILTWSALKEHSSLYHLKYFQFILLRVLGVGILILYPSTAP